jgi:hypothetical protein
MTDFKIAPSSLDTGGQGIQQCHSDYMAAVEKLKGRVLGHGSPWGQNNGGSMFGELYTECTMTGLQALAHLGDVLESVHHGLSQMSQNVQQGDQKNATNFDKVY